MQRRQLLQACMGATAGLVAGITWKTDAVETPIHTAPPAKPPFKSCRSDDYVIRKGDMLAWDRKIGGVRPLRSEGGDFIGVALDDGEKDQFVTVVLGPSIVAMRACS